MKIEEKPLAEYPWYLQPIFRSQKKKYGAVLKSGLLWARVPRLFAAVSLLFGVLERKSSPIDPQLRSLVLVRVSQINWCSFCVDINSAKLMERAGSMDKLDQLENWWENDLFDEKEKVALEYAEAVTYTDRQVSENLMSRLGQHFDEDTIVELTGLIAFQNLSSKFNAALDIPAQGFCKVPASK
ncbi:MAG: carboxymuconolactone decarboxylase family protein [SAR324 cluster bacterium]|nr:carboxymuconolactone decarboxylase family protein [SAR324 cluster bacterium]